MWRFVAAIRSRLPLSRIVRVRIVAARTGPIAVRDRDAEVAVAVLRGQFGTRAIARFHRRAVVPSIARVSIAVAIQGRRMQRQYSATHENADQNVLLDFLRRE